MWFIFSRVLNMSSRPTGSTTEWGYGFQLKVRGMLMNTRSCADANTVKCAINTKLSHLEWLAVVE